MIGSNVGGLNQMLSVLHCQKGASSKSAVPCPIIVNKYNENIGGLTFAINTLQHIILTGDQNFVFICAHFFM